MSAISTVFATQIYVDLRGNIIACILAVIQIFLCFIFHKIDVRNKFLIKHTEKIIKDIENGFDESVPRILISEEQSTEILRLADKKKMYLLRQLSTTQLYNLFYTFFVVLGLIEFVFSIILIVLG